MEKRKVVCLFLFVVLILVSSSCHSRNISDIKPAMTKEKVVSLWGPTNLITYKNANGFTLEIWEYHFTSSDSICSIIFVQDRVARTECRPLERRQYSQLEIQPCPEPYYSPQLVPIFNPVKQQVETISRFLISFFLCSLLRLFQKNVYIRIINEQCGRTPVNNSF